MVLLDEPAGDDVAVVIAGRMSSPPASADMLEFLRRLSDSRINEKTQKTYPDLRSPL